MRCLSSALRCALITIAGATSASAQTAKFADPEKANALASSGVANMGQVTLALLIVLGVLFAAAWGMRRFKLFAQKGQTALAVVQGVNLGPKERAVLITVQGRKLLLGVAPGCVNLLLELPADSTTDVHDESASTSIAEAAPINTSPAPDFKTLLKRSMGLS
jgi:flagellar protein FliO/FliZ